MGKTSAAPQSTPHSLKGGDTQKSSKNTDVDEVFFQQNLFYMTVLNMTWQLAVVVIVPIVAGFKLDEHFDLSPWLTLLGLLVAAGGMMVVVMSTVKRATFKASQGAKK
ncbi:hypothetical protein BH09PAT4_BH09PAT4_05160 [soil metagenome]|jgi:F0F1-type ATP synthase assembly protein I